MERNKIETIVREILSDVLQNQSQYASPPPSEKIAKNGITLLLLTGAPSPFKTSLRELIQTIAENMGPIIILASRSAVERHGSHIPKKENGNILRIIQEGKDPLDVFDLLRRVNRVLVPLLSLYSLSKAVQLIGDTAITNAIVRATLEGIPLWVGSEGPLQERPNPMIKEHAKESLEKLGNMGAHIIQGESFWLQTKADFSDHTPNAHDCPQLDCCMSCGGNCARKVPHHVRSFIRAGACRIASPSAPKEIPSDLAQYIDHTLLKPDTTIEQIRKICEEAAKYHFASVCINPGFVSESARLLQGTGVKVCTVIGFPLGATTTTTKALETRDAIANGADEIDMVINIGALKGGRYDEVRRDIEEVVQASAGRVTKVILETSLLTREEKIVACQLSKIAGASFVKTSTGFSTGGATAEDIELMRKTVGPMMGVKASGGVRSQDDAKAMIAAGATRIGASASIKIVSGQTDSNQSGDKY